METLCSSLENTVPMCANQSASVVVHELLESLLDEVLSVKDCDIAAKSRRLISEGITDKSVNNFNSTLDPVALIRENFTGKDIIVEMSLTKCHTTILQPRCLEQKASGNCGHYALHNVLCMMEMYSSKSSVDAVQLIEETQSSGAFWRRYWWTISQLLKRAHVENFWPWTEEHIIEGDMERSFLRHILMSDPHVQHMGGRDKIIVLQYGYGHLQNTFNELCEAQCKIDSFRSTPGQAHISFILGITNHWLAATVYKTGEQCSCLNCHTHSDIAMATPHEKISMIILDSNNNSNIILTNEDIIEKVNESEKKRIAKKGKGFCEWRKSMFIQSHQDQRDFVIKLANCVGGAFDLRYEKAEVYVKDMLQSYTVYVTTPLNESGSDCYLPFLIHWLEQHYPPKVLRDSLMPLASSGEERCLSRNTCYDLSEWAEINFIQLQELSLCGLTNVQSFADVISHVRSYLIIE